MARLLFGSRQMAEPLSRSALRGLSIQLFDPDGAVIYPTPEHRAERERQAAW